MLLLILAFPILGAVLMGGLIGKPWGYYGRMPYFAFPLVLLLLSVVLSSWVNVQRSTFRVGAVVGLYVAAIGLSMAGFPSGSLGAAVQGRRFRRIASHLRRIRPRLPSFRGRRGSAAPDAS